MVPPRICDALGIQRLEIPVRYIIAVRTRIGIGAGLRRVWDTASVSEDMALADMDRAITAAQAIVAGIRDEQWAAPTPCTGVDVRALVNHLVIGNLHFAALVNQAPLPDRDADHLGGDTLAAFGRAAAELREAYAKPGVLTATYAPPSGPALGVALVRARIVEHLGHGWDLRGPPGSRPASPTTLLNGPSPRPGASSLTGRRGRAPRSPPRCLCPRRRPPSTGSPAFSARPCDGSQPSNNLQAERRRGHNEYRPQRTESGLRL